MEWKIIPCGSLRVHAGEMHNHWSQEGIASYYTSDSDGYMRISMNALLVDTGDQVVVFDPGCADFLPSRFVASYELKIAVPLEQVLASFGYHVEQVTDVVFTHLHFDHASGAFVRKPGQICKRFPNARYHVSREHYQYARKPHPGESSSFIMAFFRYLDEIHWLEDWQADWIRFHFFNGHTKAMAVPGIKTSQGWLWYLTDLIPMESFFEREVSSSYDLDPELARQEKVSFLDGIGESTEFIMFHDPLKNRRIYP